MKEKILQSPFFYYLLLTLISIPTFYRMIRSGIYSMQDFHFFRLVEFDKCIQDLQIPCRWAPDAGAGFGEPVFNFYGQLAYVPGEITHLLGISQVDSLKIIFILSLVGSSLSMYLLSKQIWKNNLAALLSAIVYLYAPYRSVDVWVRAALPEAVSFVLFPLIVYFLNGYLDTKRTTNLLFYSLFLAILICTHNLSVLMFAPFLVIWFIFKYINSRDIKLYTKVIVASLFSLLISAYYLLPVIYESKYINYLATTTGYFDFRGHFAELNQLLLSRYWGYGGSVFGAEDGLSLSIGQVQWILPLIILVLLFFTKKRIPKEFFLIMLLGWFYLFLTHNKSTFIWENLTFMKFVQFPWRFLGMAIFCFSLACGVISNLPKKYITCFVLIFSLLTIVINVGYFKEDLWLDVNDESYTSGKLWTDQQWASLGDYWPNYANQLPQSLATFPEGIIIVRKNSFGQEYKISNPKSAVLPLVYFPGWKIYKNGNREEAKGLGPMSLISIENITNANIVLRFENTPIRYWANIISSFSLLLLILGLLKQLRIR